MSDINNNEAAEENTQIQEKPVQEGLHEDTTEQEVQNESAKEESTASPNESSAQVNFKKLREAKDKAERERDELIRYFKETQQSKETAKEPEEDEEIHLGPDDLAEGKHLTKVAKKIKKLEEQLKSYQQKSTAVSIETQLKNQYPDFDKVVTSDNLKSLKESYPEIASTISSTTDLYSKAVSAYTLLKKLNIHVEDTYQNERDIVHKNISKPRPLTSVSPQQGDSPLSKANAFANGLTDELKSQLYKEIVESRKGY